MGEGRLVKVRAWGTALALAAVGGIKGPFAQDGG